MERRETEREYVRKVQEDGRRYQEDQQKLLRKLHDLVDGLQADRGALEDRVRRLQEELAQREQEQAETRHRLKEIISENERLAGQYSSLERENSNLASLYVAAFRLHSTLRRAELLTAIEEVAASLIGCEELVLFEREEGRLQPIWTVGLALDQVAPVPVGTGVVGRCVLDGQRYVREGEGSGRAPADEAITACIPLVVDGEVKGALAIFRLLCQKPGLEPLDYELFDLLTTHAAVALHATAGDRARV